MRIFDIDFDDDFIDSFMDAGCSVGHCACGKEHICIGPNSVFMHWASEEEYNETIREAETNFNVIIHEYLDAVSYMAVGGKYFIAECACEGWKPYMKSLIAQRLSIEKFLDIVDEKYRIALENEKTFNILKSNDLTNLDKPPF